MSNLIHMQALINLLSLLTNNSRLPHHQNKRLHQKIQVLLKEMEIMVVIMIMVAKDNQNNRIFHTLISLLTHP